MRCFIPSAGLGTRMKDLTINVPKPLLCVHQVPLIYYSIFIGYRLGIREFIFNTHYLRELMEDKLSKIKNIQIYISSEKEQILGTAGGICTALKRFQLMDQKLLVINPDAIYIPSPNFKLSDFKEKILLYLSKKSPTDDYTTLDFYNQKVYFRNGQYFYTGLSIIEPSIFLNMPIDKYFDLRNTFIELSQNNELDGIIFDGKVIDVGDKSKYELHKDKNLLKQYNQEFESFLHEINDPPIKTPRRFFAKL